MASHNHISQDEVIRRFKKAHGDRYDYSLVDYKYMTVKVKIICSKHGIFDQEPTAHFRGHGCKICGEEQRMKKVFGR